MPTFVLEMLGTPRPRAEGWRASGISTFLSYGSERHGRHAPGRAGQEAVDDSSSSKDGTFHGAERTKLTTGRSLLPDGEGFTCQYIHISKFRNNFEYE